MFFQRLKPSFPVRFSSLIHFLFDSRSYSDPADSVNARKTSTHRKPTTPAALSPFSPEHDLNSPSTGHLPAQLRRHRRLQPAEGHRAGHEALPLGRRRVAALAVCPVENLKLAVLPHLSHGAVQPLNRVRSTSYGRNVVCQRHALLRSAMLPPLSRHRRYVALRVSRPQAPHRPGRVAARTERESGG